MWRREELLGMIKSSADLKQRMDHVVVEAAIRRLINTPDGAHMKDYLRVFAGSWTDPSLRMRKLQSMRTERGAA